MDGAGAGANAAQTDARTLFVRNVAFDVDAAQLEEVFTDVGPVRQCFLVTDKAAAAAAVAGGGGGSTGSRRHKGIAFVQFALPEDAERALEELSGREVAGRRLKIERALKRAPLQERKQKKRQVADGEQEGAAADTEAAAAAPDSPDQQQEKAAAAKSKGSSKKAAAAAADEQQQQQPPSKRQRTASQHQQQQQGVVAGGGAPAGTAADKHKWLRTVALGVQSPGVYLATAQQLAAACGGLTEVMDPPPADVASKAHLTQDGCSGHVLFLVYDTVKSAAHAVAQLHGQHLTPAAVAAAAATAAAAAGGGSNSKSKKLGRKQAKRLAKQQQQQEQQQQEAAAAVAAAAAAAAAGAGSDASAAGVTLWARAVSGEGAHVKKWRIILRNLAFQATEPELRKLLSASGAFVWDVQLPRGADGRVRGFAFASFTSYPEAERAIKAVNGQLLRKRPVAADWALGKAQYEGLKGQQQQQHQQQPVAAAGGGAGSDDDDDDDGGSDGSDSELGSSSGDEEEEGSDDVSEGSEGLSGGSQEEEIGMESDESGDVDDDDDGDDESSGGDVTDSGSEEEQEEEQGADVRAERDAVASALDAVLKGQQQQQQQPGAANGVAVGSKAPVAGKQQQQPAAKQQQLGAAAAAGAAGGLGGVGSVSRTVFVRGLPLDATTQELQARFDRYGPVKACRVVLDKTTGKPKGTAFIEFKAPEPAAAAAAASARAREGKGPGVTVKGVTLTVDLALTQDDARRLGVEQSGGGAAAAAAGQQQKGSAAAAAAAVGPGGKFDRRNLYLTKEGFIEEGSTAWAGMSENDRRKRKRAAEERNQKLKSPNFAVSTTRLAVRNIPGSWDEKKLKAAFIAGVKERATKESPKVVQVKILRDAERTDAGGHPGGKSRGFGFVEFSDHSHALAALRQLNNNPKAFGSSERRPVVEFAVDNIKVLRLRQDKLQMQRQQRQQRKDQQQQQNGQAGGNGGGDGDEAGGQQQQQQQEEGSDGEQEGQEAAAGAGDGGGRDKGAGKGPKPKQQPQQPQDDDEGAAPGEPLTKRQLKRRKDKAKRIAKWQQQHGQQQGQQGGAAATAADGKLGGQQQQQRGGKRGAAAAAVAATAAAATAQAARLAAKSARQQQKQRAEEAVRGQKRRADDLLDRLAASADGDTGFEQGRGGGRHRQQQQQQQQQAGAGRKRGPAAAAAAGAGDGAAKKRHKPGRAAEERLEQLVDNYKAKLFGLGSAAGAAGGKQKQQSQQQQRSSLSRWFE